MRRVVGGLVATYYRTAAFCGQYELAAAVREKPADVFLAAPVVVRCVDEVDPAVDDCVQDLLGLGVLDRPAAPNPRPTHLHRAVTQLGHRQSRPAQQVLRHRLISHENSCPGPTIDRDEAQASARRAGSKTNLAPEPQGARRAAPADATREHLLAG